MTLLDCIWNSPPADLVLPHDEIHVWCASLDQPPSLVAQLVQTLSADERLRAERYHFARDRQSFIISHGLLRMILAGYLDMEPGRLQFCYGPYGKLALAETSNCCTLQFNMSHSHKLALFAFARDREVGVDVEYIRTIPEAKQIAEHYFSEQEREILHSLPLSRMYEQFFTYWTRLEAYLKASGDGLAGADKHEQAPPLLYTAGASRSVYSRGDPCGRPGGAGGADVTGGRLAGAGGHPGGAQPGPPPVPMEWSIDSMVPAPGYVAALAVQGKVASMRTVYWQWIPFAERREVVYEPGERG